MAVRKAGSDRRGQQQQKQQSEERVRLVPAKREGDKARHANQPEQGGALHIVREDRRDTPHGSIDRKRAQGHLFAEIDNQTFDKV